MASLNDITLYINELLTPEKFQEYCPNGLQVEGKIAIKTLVSGVTANQALLDAAIDKNADAILVHHGYFWKGENATITGIKRQRIQTLLSNAISLLAYHLPLDGHPIYGNNAQLAQRLELDITSELDTGPGNKFGYIGKLKQPMLAHEFTKKIDSILNREPLHIGDKNKTIETIAWCSGGAPNYIDDAIKQGCDAYLTGEINEHTVHTAREASIHCYAAGHHATERYGVQALGEHIAKHFNLTHHFIDIDSPI
jgi:dinuclear metal center YbgI/SA1388 family protein